MDWIQTLAGEEGERFLLVKDLIDQAAADQETAEQVSVLGLTCGTGKSSAISLKIAETIHAVMEGSGEGLLIVSDTKAALKRYLSPDHMPKVKEFLRRNWRMISRLDEDTYPDEKDRFWACPVLLMTYSRYFSSDRNYIKNRYLRWGNGLSRTRIIMDEEPPILEHITIGNSAIAKVDAGIRNGLVTQNPEEREWCLGIWEGIANHLHEIFEGHGINLYGEAAEEYFLYKAEEEFLTREDHNRFVHDIESSYTTILEEDLDIPVYLDEMLRIISRGAYGSGRRKPDGSLRIAFNTVRNNGNLITGLGAKVIVLDGTADISTAYDHDYIHKVPCEDVNTKKFPELTIKLFNVNTSKNAFSLRQDEIIQTVRKYLEAEGESLDNVTVFTYKDRPESGFRQERAYDIVEHIGNTRGRNDLSDKHQVAQVGLYRKPPLMYTLECFELNEEKAHGEDCLSAAVWDFPSENIHGFLQMMNNEVKEPNDLMIRTAAVDFEQNVFRTALRKPGNTEPVTYYLFTDTDYFSLLVGFIHERFEGKYGSRVEEPDEISQMIEKIRRKPCAANRLIGWLAGREYGEVFGKKTMLMESDLTENQFSSVKKDHPKIAEWFDEMYRALPSGVPRKGYYKMTERIWEYLNRFPWGPSV